jgi:hypothetical protein
MTFKIEYTSRRREIWDWYSRAWRQRLWKSHVMVFLAVALTVGLSAKGSDQLSPAAVLLGLAWGFGSILCMLMFPLLMFKPHMRTLEINEHGISTSIGKRSDRRSWADIRSVSEENSHIIILSRNGNAFIVPLRAFASIEERQRFLCFAQSAVEASLRHGR